MLKFIDHYSRRQKMTRSDDMTIRAKVDEIHERITNLGADLSPSDTGRIIGWFLQEVLMDPGLPAGFNEIIQQVADECLAVKDE
jgi:hypothetical protein